MVVEGCADVEVLPVWDWAEVKEHDIAIAAINLNDRMSNIISSGYVACSPEVSLAKDLWRVLSKYESNTKQFPSIAASNFLTFSFVHERCHISSTLDLVNRRLTNLVICPAGHFQLRPKVPVQPTNGWSSNLPEPNKDSTGGFATHDPVLAGYAIHMYSRINVDAVRRGGMLMLRYSGIADADIYRDMRHVFDIPFQSLDLWGPFFQSCWSEL